MTTATRLLRSFIRAVPLLLGAVFVLSLQPARASTWTHSVADTTTNTGKNLSLAVDPAGKLHIGYLDTTNTSAPFLKYATNASGPWSLESLINIIPDATNASTATVFTPGGPRIMAYSYNGAMSKTMYRAARKVTGDGWQVQDIGGGLDPRDNSQEPAMTAVSTSTQTGSAQYMGFTYITYNDGTKLWYANEKDMQWYNVSAAGSAAGNGGIQSDLAIDSLGNAHVVYVDALGNMMYKMNPTAPGQAATIRTHSNNGIANPSIGIDSNDTLYLVYTDNANQNNSSSVYYMYKGKNDANWTYGGSIGTCGKSGGYTTLKVDSVNNVHVAWYFNGGSSTTPALMYNMKTFSTGTWLTTPETVVSNTGQYAAMAIDQYNTVNIAYYTSITSNTGSLDVMTKQAPAIDASPSSVLFGDVPQYGTSAPQTVTITNKGNANLVINTIGAPTPSSYFSVVSNGCTPLPKTLAAGASCAVTYQFAPTVPGPQTATVSIGSTDPNIPTKSVTLNGTTVQTGNHTITAGINNMYGGTGTITPAGAVSVPDNINQTFTITPDPGSLVAAVLIDGVSKGALTSYTFPQVTGDHNITVFFMPYVAVTSWSTTEIDNTSTATGKNLSIAVDPANKLHIGYLDTTSGTAPFLKYATNVGGTWSLTSLKDILPNAMNASTATVYTPAGPRIMAYTYDSATLLYKYQAVRMLPDGSWQLQDIGGGINPLDGITQEPAMTTVDPATQTGALQYMGFTFITFNNGAYLQYANERDMAWYKISNAGSADGNAGTQSDLGIDSAGNIHVVYVDALGNLKYAKNPTAPGQATTIQSHTTGAFTNPSIAVDASNTLHVIYLDPNGYKVMYTKLVSGGSWSAPKLVGPAGNFGNYLSIKADNTGGIHIAYYFASSATTGLLMYNHILPTGAWGSEEIIKDPNGSANYGQYPAIAIDNNNIVNIAYFDATRSSLKVATKQTFAIDASPSPLYFGNVAQGSSDANTVTVTNKGNAPNLLIRGSATISGANASEFSIGSNTCTNGLSINTGAAGCTVTVNFSPTTPGAKTATLTIGSNDILVPSKTVQLSGTSNAPASYTITAGVIGVGGRISPAGLVSVAGSANQTFTITPDPGYIVAFVAVDPQGQTQQAMMAASQGALTSYTFNQVTANHGIYVMFMQAIPVTSWNITEVDNSATDTGKYCSITNDPNGKLYVGYMDTTSATVPLLKYATNRSGVWASETVSTIPNVTAAGTATVFSEGVGPRVMAYSYNSTTGARKYGAARKWTETDNHWELQWIAGDFFPTQYGGGPQPPIYNTTTDTFTGATQYNGFTFITYSDGNNLWYANEKDFYYLKLDPTHSIAGAGKQSDLTLDAAGNIHIVYYTPGASGTGELRYGTGQGSNSTGYTETILVTGITSDPSITIDGNNTLHVSYIKSGSVMYLNGAWTNNTRVWSAPSTIGPCGANGAYTSIKANGLNIVHLTYYAYNSANASGKLMYVNRSAAGYWSTPQAVTDTSANFGQYAALTVDTHHNVNIAYYDVTRASLKVAERLIPVITGPTTVNYGNVVLNTVAYQTINIANAGQDLLQIGTASIDGVNASNFAITANTCNNSTLIIGAGCSITVAFSTATEGAMTAKLHITSNDRYTPDMQVALSGTGVPTVITHTITAIVGTGGTITPPVATVNQGADQSFTVTANAGYYINAVTSDDPGMTCSPANGLFSQTCILHSVSADHTITASFVLVQPFLLSGSSFFYGTLQSAYDFDIGGRTIMGMAVTSTENLLFDDPVALSFEGGYDAEFSTHTGSTTVRSIIVTNGTINLESIIFQ